jgi:hypothetical protein
MALAAGAASCVAAPKAPVPARVPWLVIDSNGGYRMARYGYRDRADGKMAISAAWADARPLKNGFAVVGERRVGDGSPPSIRYGVIDANGKIVIPPEYDAVELVTRGPLTLVFAKKEYNAWWRFWQWNWNFSLLGTSSPLTRVLRDEWTVTTLPRKQVLLSERTSYLKGTGQGYHRRYHGDAVTAEAYDILPFALQIPDASDLFSIGRRLFRVDAGGVVRQASDAFASFGLKGAALVRDGAAYDLISQDGHRASAKLALASRVTFRDSKGNVLVPVLSSFSADAYWWAQFGSDAGNPSNHYTAESLLAPDFRSRFPFITQRSFYQDEHGRQYLAPNFRVPLPSVVQDFDGQGGKFRAGDIIGHARLIAALPGGNGFLLAMRDDFAQPGRAFILNTDGSWNASVPAFLRGPVQFFPHGRIFFVSKSSRGVLNADFTFTPLPLTTASPCSGNAEWYLGQDVQTRKYGVYDASGGRWQVPPQYDYLQDELVPGIAVYRMDMTAQQAGWNPPVRRYGLIDIARNKAVTPPLYDFVDTDGRVGQLREITNSYGVKLDRGFSFYLDPHTGEPFVSELSEKH